MAEERVTNELMLELLKKLQEDIAGLRLEVRSLRGELLAMKTQLMALVQADLTRSSDLAEPPLRVERIERRLELNDGNA